jgi:hypothetical protein
MRKVQKNLVGLKLSGTHQLLVYAHDATLLEDNTDTAKRDTEALIEACKEASLEVNAEKTEYMLLSHHQNADQNHDMKISNRSFGNVEKCRYLKNDNNKSKFHS